MIEESFGKPELNPQLAWLNEPDVWSVDTAARRLAVWPGAQTDFWQRTHYGFTADSGHFLHAPVSGDFTQVRLVPPDGELVSPTLPLRLSVADLFAGAPDTTL